MRVRIFLFACLAALVPFGAMQASAAADEPVKIRVGWLLVPAEITPILFPVPGIARPLHDAVHGEEGRSN